MTVLVFLVQYSSLPVLLVISNSEFEAKYERTLKLLATPGPIHSEIDEP